MKRVTRSDVAREAGVSETIVSYVMNANRYVDREKKERVLEAVRRLGYHPSPLARALKGKGTDHCLLIADDLRSEHFSLLVFEMEKYAASHDLCISLSSDRKNWSLLDWNFDALVIASSTMSEERINQYIATGIPTIVLGMKKYDGLEGTYGLIDSGLREGTREAMDHLFSRGRKSIVYVPSLTGNPELLLKDWRSISYREAMEKRGLSPRTVAAGATVEDLERNIRKEWHRCPFDGVFARTDTIAAVVMKSLAKEGISGGKDVSIVGVNNSSLSRYVTPSLTTVGIRRDEIAKAIIDLVDRLRKGEKENLSVLLETDLIVRESS